MRGLEKKLHEKGQTRKQTDGHRNSMKESAKGRFFEKIPHTGDTKSLNVCG